MPHKTIGQKVKLDYVSVTNSIQYGFRRGSRQQKYWNFKCWQETKETSHLIISFIKYLNQLWSVIIIQFIYFQQEKIQ